jgi:hypothetical protein
MVMAKRECKISRGQFRKAARALKAVVQQYGSSDELARVMLTPKEFSTNSLGWYGNDKISVEVDGVLVDIQVGINFTIIGSKELPLDEPSKAAA